ncbi:hypothetical protein FACS189494_07790 [Spirochaetia bacterium]|nr:hypothetical protein FACS189494_07790 [Spirochaetia bacterium]
MRLHIIIDLSGDVYHAVPDDEVAYHCGSSRLWTKKPELFKEFKRRVAGFPATAKN